MARVKLSEIMEMCSQSFREFVAPKAYEPRHFDRVHYGWDDHGNSIYTQQMLDNEANMAMNQNEASEGL